jgi:CHAT domain-containing protein
VCSQWSVDDEATKELIAGFFADLRANRDAGGAMDYAAALRDAKLKLRMDARWGTTPRFWAPFVLVGAP